MIKNFIDKSEKIVVLTGAGVSTESGIPDFQQRDEEWKHDVDREIATSIWYFKDEPQKFWNIYKEIFGSKSNARPNRFHYFLSSLQNNHDVTIVTQNVDGLHKAAGSEKVIEVHGNLQTVICLNNDYIHLETNVFPYENFIQQSLPKCPECDSVLKPNVSLFGEGIQGFSDSRDEMMDADLLIVAGTSLQVGPINELPLMAQYYSPKTKRIWINNQSPNELNLPEELTFHESFNGNIAEFIDSYHN